MKPEKNHSFSVKEAQKYGIEKAIILFNLRHWLEKNQANKTNMRDGYYWTYNSSSAFGELFPYMNERSIRRWLQELEDAGVILSANFNRNKYDKTKWYTIPSEYASPGQDDQGTDNPPVFDEPSLTHFGQSGQTQIGQPIPDITPNVTSDVNPSLKGGDKNQNVLEKENTNTVLADLDGRAIEFRRAVLDAGGTIYTQKMLEHFIEYWTEPNRAPKPKMKFEKEKHFEFKRRLKWWAENPRRKNDGYPVYLTGNAKTIAEKKAAFKEMLRPFIPRYGTEFLNSFYQTWSSPENIPDPQFLMWEKEPFWDLGNTLAKWHTTWLKRNQNKR